MASDRKDSSLDPKHQAILMRMQKEQKANDHCADCGAKAPRWASVNIGAFLCISCSGVHRSIGTHVSVIRSITLDTWTPRQVEHFALLGNAKSSAIYEEFLPTDFRRPSSSDSQSLERFIRDKYEKKLFASIENGGLGGVDHAARRRPGGSAATSYDHRRHEYTSSSSQKQWPRPYDAELVPYQQSSRMRSSAATSERISSSKHSTSPYQRAETMKQILDMGFPAHLAVRALEESNGDLQSAVEWVLQHNADIGGEDQLRLPRATVVGPRPAQHPVSNQLASQGDLLNFDGYPSTAPATAGAPGALAKASAGQSAPWPTDGEDWADFGAFNSALPAATPASGLASPHVSSAAEARRDATEKPLERGPMSLAALYAQGSGTAQNQTKSSTIVGKPSYISRKPSVTVSEVHTAPSAPAALVTDVPPASHAAAPCATPMSLLPQASPPSVPPPSVSASTVQSSVVATPLPQAHAMSAQGEGRAISSSAPKGSLSPVTCAKSADPFAGLASFALSASKANADAKVRAKAEAKVLGPSPPLASSTAVLVKPSVAPEGLIDVGSAEVVEFGKSESNAIQPTSQPASGGLSLDDLLKL
jgi:Putative GTPase activating protein for Arf/UBA/TS-N domain